MRFTCLGTALWASGPPGETVPPLLPTPSPWRPRKQALLLAIPQYKIPGFRLSV